MAEHFTLTATASCATPTAGAGVLDYTTAYAIAGGGPLTPEEDTAVYLLDASGLELDSQPTGRNQSGQFIGLADGYYGLEWRHLDTQAVYASAGATIGCGSGSGADPLVFTSLDHTDETAAGADGTITAELDGGIPPYLVQVLGLGLSSYDNPATFTDLPASIYTVRATDDEGAQVQQQVTLGAYVEPVAGCQDEYADNYDPAATVAAGCSYTPAWRSAWQPLAVRVAAVPGQQAGYVAASLRVGFRAGHPLAAQRPLGEPLPLRATVAPDGFATFNLGQFLRAQLGAPDGAGGYRLDLNSETATTSDLYVGYELRRAGTSELLSHGYALNSAVPDGVLAAVAAGVQRLSPFAVLPVWPGLEEYPVGWLGAAGGIGQYGVVGGSVATDWEMVSLPCPANPLPVAWLAPGGGFGYWVFSGRSVLGDEILDGQTYNEALTGQRRYADPGEARRTVKASSGVFRGDALLEGLRTLWRSTQAWYQPVAGGEWAAIVVERGSREVGRLGVLRQELTISFSEAASMLAQGQ